MKIDKIQSKSKLLFILLLLLTQSGLATENTDQPSQTLEQKFIASNIKISHWFDSIADGIDLFLVDKRLTNEPNKTSVKLINTTYSTEGQNATNEFSVVVVPRFPNLEKYWNLKFTTYDEQGDRGVNKNYLRQSPHQRNYGASVGLLRRLGQVRVLFQPRIELQDPLRISHSLIFESVANMKNYNINPKLELFASATQGPGFFHALNFNVPLDETFSLTQINEGEYYDKTHEYTATNGLSLGQIVSSKSALSYSWLFFSANHSNYHLSGYSLATSWYEIIYKNILEYHITPHLDFSEDLDFKGRAGLTIQLVLNF